MEKGPKASRQLPERKSKRIKQEKAAVPLRPIPREEGVPLKTAAHWDGDPDPLDQPELPIQQTGTQLTPRQRRITTPEGEFYIQNADKVIKESSKIYDEKVPSGVLNGGEVRNPRKARSRSSQEAGDIRDNGYNSGNPKQ